MLYFNAPPSPSLPIYHRLPILCSNTKNIINANFTLEQNRDTRHIPPPLIIPLAHISISECNHEKDIKIDTCTIQIQNDTAYIYEETRKHLITIPIDRLKWLWKQYTQSQNRPNGLIPPTQLFKTKIVWLYQRYKYRIPKTTHLNTHTTPYQKYYLITLQHPSTSLICTFPH